MGDQHDLGGLLCSVGPSRTSAHYVHVVVVVVVVLSVIPIVVEIIRERRRRSRLILLAVAAAVARLPRRLRAWLGRRLGDLGFVALAVGAAWRSRTSSGPFRASRATDRRRICRRSFQHLGLMFIELCSAADRAPERDPRGHQVDGLDHLEDGDGKARSGARRSPAHLGNWELLALIERLLGFPASVVVRPLDAPWLDGLADRWRRRTGIEIIDKRGALRPVLTAIRRGRLVALAAGSEHDPA